MPLLRNISATPDSENLAIEHKTAEVIADVWVSLSDDDELPDTVTRCVISLERYVELAQHQSTLPGGLIVGPADDVTLVMPFVEQLKLISIEFPVYTDGRGYSHARVLRKRMGYTGELRAIGDIRADQLLFMQRTGFDTYFFEHEPDAALIEELISRYKHNYQPSYPLLTQSH